MKTIQVHLDERSYSINVESSILRKLPSILSQYNLMELIGFNLMSDLNKAGFKCDYITLPVGEAAKSMNEFSRIISQLIEMKCDRSTRFFPSAIFIPVFPPMEESTMARRVVGIW